MSSLSKFFGLGSLTSECSYMTFAAISLKDIYKATEMLDDNDREVVK